MHAYRGRREGIVRREHKGTPILTTVIGRVGWAGENVVPFKDVLFRRMGDNVRRRRFGDGGVFFREAFGCCGCSHRGWVWESGRQMV